MVGETVEHLERDIGAGAAFQHHALGGDAANEVGVLDGAHAMADARRADMIERCLHTFPAHQLAGMDSDAKTCLAGDLESPYIILEIADALVTGDAETGHQRM